jgi:hypothetical protein
LTRDDDLPSSAAGSAHSIRRTVFETDKFFEISRREVSMMSTLAATAGLATPGDFPPVDEIILPISIQLALILALLGFDKMPSGLNHVPESFR